MSGHFNVVICTPGHSVMGSYMKSLFATLNELNKKEISWAWSCEFASHVGDAREFTLSGTRVNSLVQNRPFEGKFTYDKLFWIDSDISWKPEDFIKLYESDKDIISGAYMLSDGGVAAYPKLLSTGFTIDQIAQMKELTKIGGCGFGFVAVKQGVFESLTRPWFQSTPVTWKNEEDNTEIEFMMMGEDLSWCKRVQDKGYEIWLDPTVRVSHHKTIPLNWEGIKNVVTD